MRAVNTVISAAGLMKRENRDGDEDLLLLRALRDSNLPKFLKGGPARCRPSMDGSCFILYYPPALLFLCYDRVRVAMGTTVSAFPSPLCFRRFYAPLPRGWNQQV